MRFVLSNLLASTMLTVLILSSFGVVEGQVRQSSNYQLQSDSINFGGGNSSSSGYIQESTAGEIATGESSSASFNILAGYQQMSSAYLALSAAADVVMDGSISGVGGGISNGSTTVTATTDSSGGYELSISAVENPAMRSGSDTIDDYNPVGVAPDLHFSITSNEAEFAYSPFGSHTAERFQTNDVACNVSGSASTTACWDGLSLTPVPIATDGNPNHPGGTDTTIYFRVGIGAAVIQPPGDYVATTTLTLLAL